MLRRIAFLGLVLALVAPLQAQTGHAFVKFPQTKESLAQAIEKGKDGDMKVLNISAVEFVRVMNEGFNLRLENREDLANHIRGLKPVSLPQSVLIHLARLLGTEYDSNGWHRFAHPNEIGLMNRETGVIELSLDCANPIYGLVNQVEQPVVTPKKVVTPAPVQTFVLGVIESPRPEPNPIPMEIVGKSYWGRNWGWWTSGVVTAVGGYFICKNNCRRQDITNTLTNTNR